ncbi:MAG: hypothetical protein ACOCXP_00570 [Candidatus Dojkabacteria bacterium]
MQSFIRKASLALVPILSYFSLTASVLAQEDEAGGIISILIFLCLCLFIIAYIGLKVYLTIDALNRDYGEDKNGKVLGLILIWVIDWFITFVGLILYYFLIMRKYPKKA